MLLLPRTFHRIWLGTQPMPIEFLQFGESWLCHHPGWTLHTWTDAHVDRLINTEAFRRSAARSGKANVLRYEILLHHGGIYIDTDFECLRNLEPLLQGVACFVAEQSPGFANNAIMGAVPGHPFVRDLVRNLSGRVAGFAGLPSIKQSGPYYMNEVLRGRRDVTIFPSELFYPYAWHERWRRHERFERAYAVHHWSLSWRKLNRSRPCRTKPTLSVLLMHIGSNTQRLQWVLEALCEQTAAGSFEVLIVDQTMDANVHALGSTYADRLRIGYIATPNAQRGLLSEDAKICASCCRSARVLLLDGNCIPERSTLETHAAFGDDKIVAFSHQQLYPRRKLFPFTPPLDYDALKIHSVPDRSHDGHKDGETPITWRDIPESCISLPLSSLIEHPVPRSIALRAGGRWLAQQLSLEDHSITALPWSACVTRMER